MLIRTQVMLDSKIKRDLKRISRMRKRSMSRIIRSYLYAGVKMDEKEIFTEKSAKEILERIAEIGVKGPGDGKYDEYIYQ